MGSKSVRQKLNFDTMGELDHGSLRVAINDALKLMGQDLHDRPALDAKRKMTFTLAMAPKRDKNAATLDLEEIDLSWEVGLKVPGKGASGTVLSVQNDGMFAFVADVPDAGSDETIFDEQERRRFEREERDREQRGGGDRSQAS